MAMTWYEKGPVAGPGIAKAGGTGPPADTYYYIIVPYVTTDVNISPDFAFYWYNPQYYGKRSAELSIAVNGAEEVILSWTQVAGCDGYLVFRTTVSGRYNKINRDRMWHVGNVATFTDNNQASTATYNVNIPERNHGCVVLTSAYALQQVITDLIDVQGEDSALVPLSSAGMGDETISAGGVVWGPVAVTFFKIHLHTGSHLYPNFYGNQAEQAWWLHWDNIYVNNGGTLSLGSQLKTSTYHGATFFSFNRSAMQPGIYGVPGATISGFGIILGQYIWGGSASYIDDYINGDVTWGAVICSGCRTIGKSDGNADLEIDGMDYFESYYQYGLRSGVGAGVNTLDRYRAHEVGHYFFGREAYDYSMRNYTASDWRAHPVAADLLFYASGANRFTGNIRLYDPIWKDRSTSTPAIDITDLGVQHTGTFDIYFTLNLKVVDQNGNALVGATVNVYDKDDNLLNTDTTGADGTITEQDILHCIYSCDASNNLVVGSKYPHRLQVILAGYRDVNYNLVIERPLDMTIPMSIWSAGPGGPTVTFVESPIVRARGAVTVRCDD